MDRRLRIAASIEAGRPSMFALLREMVEIQSGSRNTQGLQRMAECCGRELRGIGLEVSFIDLPGHGPMVRAANPTKSTEAPSLLIGHMDTVFPEDTGFTEYREDGEKAYGPGVYDMKGGLVAAIFALRALKAEGLLGGIPVSVLFNPDEEIGSPASGPFVRDEARRSARAFVLEGGGLDGQVVTGRKGKLGFRLEVAGMAGHAGNAAQAKASAVLELAHKVIGLEALNSPPGRTVNVGRIEGGIGPNTVAERAAALVDARAMTPEGLERLRERIEALTSAPVVPGTACTLTLTSMRPTMPQSEPNRELFRLVQNEARTIGLELTEELRSGVSDANLVAAESVPVLDGLGPTGDLDHSDREYIVKSSLPQRSCLLALALARLGE
jgi:glutamate carboxypeptidase